LGFPSPAVERSESATPKPTQPAAAPSAAAANSSAAAPTNPRDASPQQPESDQPVQEASKAQPQAAQADSDNNPGAAEAPSKSVAHPPTPSGAASQQSDDLAGNSPPAPRQKPVVTEASETQRIASEHRTTFVDNGGQELQMAQQYLNGSSRNSAQAAQWLWKAVAKQNPTALVLLSDLYLRGDGVPKSCDQARILLVAAAKKGAPNVAPTLRSLELHGCQ
jgi:TPR repeat protein